MTEKVECPVCKGDGQLSYQAPRGCLCCNGEGTISATKAAALAQIRTNLAKRLGIQS